MIQKIYRAGEVLFHEGELSEFVCRLVSGEADVIKHNEGEAVILGTARPGEFVGEIGVIENSPRSATVRAVSAVTAEVYPKDEFLLRVSQDGVLALQLMVRLAERLKTVNAAFVEAVSIGQSVPQGQSDLASALPPLRIFADSPRVAQALPPEGVLVETLSFVVGRIPEKAEAPPKIPVDLALQDRRPYRLSRVHFAIDAVNGTYRVRDLHSTLGTDVNGRGFGGMFAADEAVLESGENVVIAGGRDSPYRFRLVI